MLAIIGRLILGIWGWKAEGHPPNTAKYVVIAAPHTSNWDFPITLFFAWKYRLSLAFFMKDEMFRPPFGWFFRWAGGIPINRRAASGMVEQSIARFDKAERLALVVPPEGTRAKVTTWKTGFYHIAHGAGVPIAMGFLDFQRKVGGFGPTFYPTGDIDADMAQIRAFYASVSGKNPQQVGAIELE